MSNIETNYFKWGHIIATLKNADIIAQSLGFESMEILKTKHEDSFKNLCDKVEFAIQEQIQSKDLGGPPCDQGSSGVMVQIPLVNKNLTMWVDSIFHAADQNFEFKGIHIS